MIIKIDNQELKDLLEKKGAIVEAGRLINNDLELKGRTIVDKHLKGLGVVIKGDTYSGDYNLLQNAFGYKSRVVMDEIIKSELKEELESQGVKSMELTAINEKIQELLKSEIVPTLTLGEFEYPTNVEINKGIIEMTIVDAVEEFKNNFKEKNKVK